MIFILLPHPFPLSLRRGAKKLIDKTFPLLLKEKGVRGLRLSGEKGHKFYVYFITSIFVTND